jgi:hypothetical protein
LLLLQHAIGRLLECGLWKNMGYAVTGMAVCLVVRNLCCFWCQEGSPYLGQQLGFMQFVVYALHAVMMLCGSDECVTERVDVCIRPVTRQYCDKIMLLGCQQLHSDPTVVVTMVEAAAAGSSALCWCSLDGRLWQQSHHDKN